MNWRRSDFISASTLLTVLMWLIWASQRVDKWDVVMDSKRGNDALDTRVTVLETHIADRDKDIERQLHAIYEKVK